MQQRSKVECVTGWVGGQNVDPVADAHRLSVVDPATEAVVAELVEDDAAAVDRAVTAARTAFDDGIWSRTSVAERQRILRAIADGIDSDAEALAQIECTQTGIPIVFLRAMHLPRAAQNFRFFADYIGQRADRAYHQEAGYRTLVVREPIGVAALTAPWNVPLGLGLMKVAGAIAFGNSCVLKPSELTPLGFGKVLHIMQAAGLPDGVVNLVNGRGSVTGAALVAHPGVDAVSFTGGTETGRAIGRAAADAIKPVTMELGGKSANIVCDDADLDAAVAGSLLAAFSNNGQQCLAGSRLLLQRGIADAFLERFLAATQALKVGDPQDPATQMGPLQSRAHRDRVLSYVEVAREEGCEVLHGGGTAAAFEHGWYIDPIVVWAPDNRARVCQEEIFGPFVTVLIFDTVEEAVAIANDSPFGLVAYGWTASLASAQAISSGVRAGVVWINTPMMRDLRAPFGGYRDSGIGRESGDGCAALFTQEKTIITRL